uniref:Ig-like domain-containing protein n=1 Tax=Denticeps clupeoides TaxID=299321 RepID=A0AAY4AFP4_9TELE
MWYNFTGCDSCTRVRDYCVSTDLPKATVTIEAPDEPFYPGDTVTLKCDITGYRDWEYYWYRNNTRIPNKTSQTITLLNDSGQYKCSGERAKSPKLSNFSDSVPVYFQGKSAAEFLIMAFQEIIFQLLKLISESTGSAELLGK